MPNMSELSIKEILDYLKSTRRTIAVFSEGIGELEDRNDTAASPGEQAENTEKILDLGKKIALVKADRSAFKANNASIQPPTEAQLEELKNLLIKVDALTAENRVLEDVITLTTEGLTLFREIQSA